MAKKANTEKEPARQKKNQTESGGESLEKSLWKVADKLRKNMDAAEYKHVALADEEDDFVFEERFNFLKAELEKQIAEEAYLNKKITDNLKRIEIKTVVV